MFLKGDLSLMKLKMIKILDAQETKTLIMSGDRHKGGLYKKGDLIEPTSSSLNKPTAAARIVEIFQLFQIQ